MVASAARKTPSAAQLVLLVTAAVFINYIDRGNLATAAPLMQDELHLSASQLGILLSAFYYGYVVCMPAMGWLAERYGAKRVLAAGVTIWSMATSTTGFTGSFVTLLTLRVLLGVGESVAFPCASKVLAHAVEVSRLGVANGILSFGYLLGPAVGTLLGGYLMTVFGWRPVFIVFGAVSLVWLWPWSRVGSARSPRQSHLQSIPNPRSRKSQDAANCGALLLDTLPRTTAITSSCLGCRFISSNLAAFPWALWWPSHPGLTS